MIFHSWPEVEDSKLRFDITPEGFHCIVPCGVTNSSMYNKEKSDKTISWLSWNTPLVIGYLENKSIHASNCRCVLTNGPGDERYVCTFLSLTHAAKWVRQSKTPAGEMLVKLLREESPFYCFYLSHRSWRFLRCPLQIHMYMWYINILYISDI